MKQFYRLILFSLITLSIFAFTGCNKQNTVITNSPTTENLKKVTFKKDRFKKVYKYKNKIIILECCVGDVLCLWWLDICHVSFHTYYIKGGVCPQGEQTTIQVNEANDLILFLTPKMVSAINGTTLTLHDNIYVDPELELTVLPGIYDVQHDSLTCQHYIIIA